MANDISIVYSLKDNFTSALRNISSNQKKFQKDLDNASKELAILYDKKRQLQVDNKAADKAIKNTMKNAEQFGDTYEEIMRKNAKQKLEIQLDTQEINNRIKETQSKISALNKTKANPKVSLKDNVTKELNSLKQKLNQVVKDKYGINITAKTSSATNKIKTVTSKVMSIGRLSAAPMIKITDMATKGISKIMSSLKNLAKPVNIAIAMGGGFLGLGEALKQGSDLETQKISMAHFIGIQNKGMSSSQVSKISDNYIQQLRNNANTTPFADSDVVSAGSRAINLAGGNTSKAMDYVKLAENMAALNPQQTLDSAMQALLDAKEGNTRMLRDFGFNISAKQVKSAGGIDNILNTKLKPFFAGGANELSMSSSGIISTIKGKLGNQVQDFGYKTLEKLKPLLQSTLDLIMKVSPQMDSMGTSLANGIGKSVELIGNLVNHLKEFQPVVGTFKNIFSSAMPIVSGLIRGLETAAQNAMPVVKQIFMDVGQRIIDILGWLGQHMTQIEQLWSWAWPLISSAIKTAWDLSKPILDIVINTIELIGDVILKVAPVVEKAISGMWSVVQPILEAFAKLLSGISEGIKFVTDHIGGIKAPSSPIVTKSVNKTGLYGVSRAIGIPRVPYDNYPAILHEGEQVLTKQEVQSSKNTPTVQVILQGTTIREDADVDKLATAVVKKIIETGDNM